MFLKTDDVSENLRKQGGFVPGIRPGEKSASILRICGSENSVLGSALAAVCLSS